MTVYLNHYNLYIGEQNQYFLSHNDTYPGFDSYG